MVDIVRIPRGGAATKSGTWGRFSVEVDAMETALMLEGIRISYQPYSLADWMETEASPLMSWSITQRFAADGFGGLTGGWAPLQESTVRIKEALGVDDPEGINTRTDRMFQALISDHAVSTTLGGAEMQIPGNVDPVLREKLKTAAYGKVQGSNDMFPGAVTPPRPVAVVDNVETMMLMMSLEVHIMNTVAMMMGGSI